MKYIHQVSLAALFLIISSCGGTSGSDSTPINKTTTTSTNSTAANSNLTTENKSVAYKVTYNSSIDSITIENQKVVYIRTEYQYDNPTSGTPSGSKQLKKEGTLNEEQSTALLRFIEQSGFLQLKDGYGASEPERFYPYEIHVTMGTTDKKVLFRSNPSFEGTPESFKKVETYLLELGKKATQP